MNWGEFMSISIAVCDDDIKQVEYIRSLLLEWSEKKSLALNFFEYNSAEEFLFKYATTQCDLILLDIEMGGINGMELAKILREKGDMLPIIFITGYSEYIADGYDVEALHYLLKPFDKAKLFAVLERYIKKQEVMSDEIIIVTSENYIHLSSYRILFIEADGRNTNLNLSDDSWLESKTTISEFACKNLAGFVLCHRSYIVNLRHIKSIGKETITLDNDKEIPLSRRLAKDVNKKFIEYYTRR